MNKEKTLLILNSTVLYILAFLVTTVIHELAHAFMGMNLGSGAILHHNYVEHPLISNLTVQARVMISLAGPIMSLIQGIAVGWFFVKIRKASYTKLFLLWTSVLGFTNFFGYLMTGPIFHLGDIGKVYGILNISLPLQIIFAVFGLLILAFVAYKLTVPFLEFSFLEEWVSNPETRSHFAFSIIILPWLIGSAVVTILYLPVVAVVSIIYPFTSGMIFIFPWKNAKRIKSVKINKNSGLGKASYILYIVLIVAIILFKFILEKGIEF